MCFMSFNTQSPIGKRIKVPLTCLMKTDGVEAGMEKEKVCCILFRVLMWLYKNHTDGWQGALKLTDKNVYIMAGALMFTSGVRFTFYEVKID